jgi:Domain of unknown function (DUF4386)
MTQELFQNRIKIKWIGIFFILAAVSSVVGLKLYGPILNNTNFILSASQNSNQIILGIISELILVVSAIGTGIWMYPYLKTYSESLGIGYLSFRILEVVFIMIGILSILTVLSVSELYANGSILDKPQANNLGLTFIALHKWTFMLGPNFMLAVNTFIYSYVFFKTKMIPHNLSKLGLTAATFIMMAAILELFGIIEQLSTTGVLLALPIVIYEMTLAIWLIRKARFIK